MCRNLKSGEWAVEIGGLHFAHLGKDAKNLPQIMGVLADLDKLAN